MARGFPRKLKSVDLYWFDDRDGEVVPVTEQFVLRCSPVCELYSIGLEEQGGMPAWSSWSRIVVDAGTGLLDIRPAPDGRDGISESAHIGIGGLGPPDKLPTSDYLEWLHQIMLAFADRRDYDRGYLDRARDYCLQQDLRVHLASTVKQSPNRAHRAQLSYTIESDGEHVTKLEIWDRAGELVGATVSRDLIASYTRLTFRKLRRRLRWASDRVIASDDDYDQLGVPGLCKIVAMVGQFREHSIFRTSYTGVIPTPLDE